MVRQWMLVLALVFIAAPVFGQCAATFCSTTYSNGAVFNVSEDQEIYLDFNISTDEANVVFADDSDSLAVNFSIFNMSQYTGVVIFTPTNDEVGMSEDILVSITNVSNSADYLTMKIFFNVSNLNNPPYIIGFDPGDVTILEGDTLLLNATVGDIDYVYGDIIWYNWTLDGNLSPKLNFTGNQSNYSVGINQFDVGVHTILMEAYDSGGENVNQSWTITVGNNNINPLFTQNVSNITIDEDTFFINNFSLDDHFYDADVNASNHDVDTGVQLLYGVSNAVDGDPVKVIFSFNNTYGNVSFSLPQDWYGNKTLYYTVFDGEATNRTNNFTFIVNPVNDLPVFNNAVNVSLFAYNSLIYPVNVTDVDNDTLSYFSDSAVFTIDPVSGVVTGSPVSADVGENLVNLTVWDGSVNVSRIFNITVLPNAVPMISDVADQTVQQESLLFVNVSAMDPLGDNISFSINYSLFGVGNRINGSLITFNISPVSQGVVGNHSVMVTVTDDKGTTNSTKFMLEIRDLPKAPLLKNVNPLYQIRVGRQFLLDLSAFDEDGNIEGFYSNKTEVVVSTINKGTWTLNATGNLSFSPVVPTLNPLAVNISVNDTTSLMDYQVIGINVTPNHAPVITFIQNITCEENSVCPYGFQGFTGMDPDWQDTAVFDDNSSLFDIGPEGNLSFVIGSRLFHGVSINLTDGDLTVWYNITVNITSIDDVPFFDPYLPDMPEWGNIVENTTVSFNITAYDEENKTCNLSIVFLNFTNLGGNVSYTGIDLFNITNYGNTTINNTIGGIYFTPNANQTGTYWVNMSVFDGVKFNSTIFMFNIKNVNNPPVVSWLFDNGSYQTNSDTSLYGLENTSFLIDVTASDPDFDNLTYTWSWEKGGSVFPLGIEQDLDYNISMLSSPFWNLTLSVDDGKNGSTNISWNFDSGNVNRMHWFGRIVDDYFKGTYMNVTNASGLKLAFSGSYSPLGVFTSKEFDIGETNSGLDRFIFHRISYTADTPVGTSVAFETRTKPPGDGSTYSSWSPLGSNGEILSPDYRYFQYRVNLTSSGASTPTIKDVNLHYAIANLSGTADSDPLLGWINLENFFWDRDTDDNFTYQVYTTSLQHYLDASVGDYNFVHITFNAEGTEYINFSCTDPFNNTVWSNTVTVDIAPKDSDSDPEKIIIPMPSSGGGTIVKYKTRIRKEKEYVSMDLIHPDNVTIYENDIMVIPVTLVNDGNSTLTNLNLSAFSENKFPLELSKTHIDELPPGSSETVTITGNLTDVYGSFQVLVGVDVESPSYTDSAKITINSLKKGMADVDLFDVKFAFAEDLLEANPKCLELKEFLNRASESIITKDIAGSMDLVDTFINDCRFMISKQAEFQSPAQVNTATVFVNGIIDNKSLRNALIIIIFVTLFFSGYLAYVKYKSV